jgi:hypothetical protein
VGVDGARVSFTPELSVAQALNCRGVALHFGQRGEADALAAAMCATQMFKLSETLTQYRRRGVCSLYSWSTCAPLQETIGGIYAVIVGIAEGLGHAPIRIGLFGDADPQMCKVAVSTALANIAAGRSGDDLRLIGPRGGIVGSVQGWADPRSSAMRTLPPIQFEDRVSWGLNLKALVNMNPERFTLQSPVVGTTLDMVPADTVDAWMYGPKPPDAIVVATPPPPLH